MLDTEQAHKNIVALFSEAEVVAEVTRIDNYTASVATVAVKRVWKGDVGKTAYVTDDFRGSLLFAKRASERGPLVELDTLCKLPVLDIDPVMLMDANFGAGYEPNETRAEYSQDLTTSSWFIGIVFLSLTALGVFTAWGILRLTSDCGSKESLINSRHER